MYSVQLLDSVPAPALHFAPAPPQTTKQQDGEASPVTSSHRMLKPHRVDGARLVVEDAEMDPTPASSPSVSSTTAPSVRNDQPKPASARQERRSTRACDTCRKSKVRCNGASPCFRCVDLGHTCEYLRVPKSRGRPRRRDLQQPDSASHENFNAVGANIRNGRQSICPTESFSPSTCGIAFPEFSISVENQVEPISGGSASTSWDISAYATVGNDIMDGQSTETWAQWEQGFPSYQPGLHDFAPIEISPWTNLVTATTPAQQGIQILQNVTSPSLSRFGVSHEGMLDNEGGTEDSRPASVPHKSVLQPLSEKRLSSPGEGSSPMEAVTESSETSLRYPVLRPLKSHLSSIMRMSEACNLLDYYFTELPNSDVFTRPHSPYILAHIFRRQSFLTSKSPRPTSAALLCAMLFISMQTCSLADLNATPSSKASLSKKLLSLSLRLLGPLAPVEDPDEMTFHCPNLDHGGDLDTVITYLHLGTVISAGDFKGQSAKWWKSAAELAMKLNLNQEVKKNNAYPQVRAEEMKEERRRTWWLVYILDRHIALCYNSPLMIPQYASDDIYLPLNETVWQGDGFAFSESIPRQCGPCYKMTSIHLFGFFLPLMTILGEIINLHNCGHGQLLDQATLQAKVEPIIEMLRIFEQSLRTVSALLGNHTSVIIQTVLCYSNHLVHVLYILLYGKWDLISMLDDSDLWVGSQQFVLCVQHGVAAAESISQILTLDPGLNHMPYLWGIYLLHGSFILVLFAEKMETGIGSNEKMVSACETALRGHEVCVATLNTEYQRDFRRVLTWTLQKIWGKDSLNTAKRSENMRRSLLLYRWNRDGRGLAL